MGTSFWSDGYVDGMRWDGLLAERRLNDVKKDLIAATIEVVPGELVIPPTQRMDEMRWCVIQGEPLDLSCDLPSLDLWRKGLSDLVAISISRHDPSRFERHDEYRVRSVLSDGIAPLPVDAVTPRMSLTEKDMQESDEYSGYWSTPAIAYRGHVVVGTVWRSYNDGLWKDSWGDFDLGRPDSKDSYCFWDDLGSVGINQSLNKAMALVNTGLSKALHYVNLKAGRLTVREVRRQA